MVLAIGVRSSRWKPNKMFPYGYGNLRYVTSLISGVGIFFIGCGVSIYHGVSGILHPEALEPMTYVRSRILRTIPLFYSIEVIPGILRARHVVRVPVLVVSARLPDAAPTHAGREYLDDELRFVWFKFSNSKSLMIYFAVRDARDPSLNVVLLEDSAAIAGVLIALASISLSSVRPFLKEPAGGIQSEQAYDAAGDGLAAVRLARLDIHRHAARRRRVVHHQGEQPAPRRAQHRAADAPAAHRHAAPRPRRPVRRLICSSFPMTRD